jgi:predicted RecA/RadA family phage recombinase
MATNQDQGVNVVDYTAGGTISSGDPIVLGTTAGGAVSVGIALVDMVSGDVGAVAIRGTFNIAKVSTAVIVQGETVNWVAASSSVEDNADTKATGDVEDFGIAMESAGNGVTTVAVQLLPGNGILSA